MARRDDDADVRADVDRLGHRRLYVPVRAAGGPRARARPSRCVGSPSISASAALGVRLLGGEGLLLKDGSPTRAFLEAPAFHIGGGTDEVQKNVVAERVLGLPRDERPDKLGPFSAQVR
ncbi:MAG: hypothetical protein E6G59_05405 [Actinobacteria bacterium]|nr:MAG: hypothetical protein E6G59_05405 [Actinomycetota bacterium]